MFANFAQCFDILLNVLPFCSMFCHFSWCFPISLVFSILLSDLPFCLEFLVLVGLDKIMNRNSHSRLDCRFLVGPTKTLNPNTHLQLDLEFQLARKKQLPKNRTHK
jgi:hypothetical protein